MLPKAQAGNIQETRRQATQSPISKSGYSSISGKWGRRLGCLTKTAVGPFRWRRHLQPALIPHRPCCAQHSCIQRIPARGSRNIQRAFELCKRGLWKKPVLFHWKNNHANWIQILKLIPWQDFLERLWQGEFQLY